MISTRLFAACLLLVCFTAGLRAEVLVADKDKIAFMGDSITQQGAGSNSGYVRLVVSGLKANDINVVSIPAGISGHKSNQMLARLDKDVIEKKPQWMTLSCGVNDVWHGERGVPLDQYKTNITSIVDKCQAAGIKVVLLTSTPIMEVLDNDLNKKLAPYNDFLRELAKQKNLPLADLDADFRAALAEAKARPHPPGHLLTGDGVHMNPLGNRVMAVGVLKALGLNDAQLQKAKDAWLDAPKGVDVAPKAAITLRQYEKLVEAAGAQNKSVNELLSEALDKAVTSLLGEPAAPAKADTPKP
jgi:lysophospholipase L1-like esterase